jgi:SAM-dependent methyltransferase
VSSRNWRAVNLANWEARVPIHVGSGGYDVERYVEDAAHLGDVVGFDASRLGALDGLDVVHLQCHIGTDTLGLARLGAGSVTGLDFSPSALAQAKALFERTGTAGRFVESDVYDAVAALDATYDLVYASVGAINWLPSVGRWFEVAHALARPGGRVYLRDVHPVLFTIADESTPQHLRIAHHYFETDEPGTFETEQTYTGDGTPLASPRTHEWSHGMADVVMGALRAGFAITEVAEDEHVDWLAFDGLVPNPDGPGYIMPAGAPRIPFTFTLDARRPG